MLTCLCSTQVAEGVMLAGMNWITVSLRKANHSFGLGVRVRNWKDILGGNRRKPTKQEISHWGGTASAPGLVIQKIKNKVN